MISLYEVKADYWTDTSTPRDYSNDGHILSVKEKKELLDHYITTVTVEKEDDEEEAAFVQVDGDDSSCFTVLMDFTQAVYPSIDLTDFRMLDEVEECLYVGDDAISIVEDIVQEIKDNK